MIDPSWTTVVRYGTFSQGGCMKSINRLLVAAFTALSSSIVWSGEFPDCSVKFVVPVSPGGSIGRTAQIFEQQLGKKWKNSIHIEYKPGAGLTIGMDYVAKSKPDGCTIGFMVTAHVITPTYMAPLPYNMEKDLSGVTLFGVTHLLLSARPSLSANTLPELIALAKQKPGKLSYASPGNGTAPHLAVELLKLRTGVNMVHVPYRGSGGGAYANVIGGHVDLLIDPIIASKQHLDAGQLKPIAIASAKRTPAAPSIPTMAEVVPGFDVKSIAGVVVPSGTSRSTVKRLNTDFLEALRTPEVQAQFTVEGMEPVGNSPEEFDALIKTEIKRWREVIEDAGIEPIKKK